MTEVPKIDHARRMAQARRSVLDGLMRGDEIDELERALAEQATRGDLDLASMLVHLAAGAIEIGGFTAGEPISYEGFRQRFLPELEFRGKVDHRGSQYAIYAAAILLGGMEPDVYSDTGWWRSELWPYALYGLVAYVRAAAERREVTTTVIAQELSALASASAE